MFDWGLLSPDFLFTYAFNACFFQFTVLQHLPSSAQLCSSFMGLFSLPQFICGFLTFIAFFQYSVQFSSVAQSCLTLCESQHARPPCPSPTPGVHSNLCPSSRWCHPAISSSVVSFSSCPQSPSALGLFQWVNSWHEVAKVLEFQLQHQSFQWTPRTDLLYDGLVGSPCSPRDSQPSS